MPSAHAQLGALRWKPDAERALTTRRLLSLQHFTSTGTLDATLEPSLLFLFSLAESICHNNQSSVLDNFLDAV